MSTKQLWAPWRMEFLKGPREDGCVFCTLVARSEDRESLIVYRSPLAFVIMNKYPYSNGHLMVVPNRHTADYAGLTADELSEMNRLSQHGVRALQEAYAPGGFNLGMNLGVAGGAGIRDHLHLHVVPRWVGDTNFLPVLADTRSMPQHLMESYDAILPYFSRIK
jgi:ATP adenylyltransferase